MGACQSRKASAGAVLSGGPDDLVLHHVRILRRRPSEQSVTVIPEVVTSPSASSTYTSGGYRTNTTDNNDEDDQQQQQQFSTPIKPYQLHAAVPRSIASAANEDEEETGSVQSKQSWSSWSSSLSGAWSHTKQKRRQQQRQRRQQEKRVVRQSQPQQQQQQQPLQQDTSNAAIKQSEKVLYPTSTNTPATVESTVLTSASTLTPLPSSAPHAIAVVVGETSSPLPSDDHDDMPGRIRPVTNRIESAGAGRAPETPLTGPRPAARDNYKYAPKHLLPSTPTHFLAKKDHVTHEDTQDRDDDAVGDVAPLDRSADDSCYTSGGESVSVATGPQPFASAVPPSPLLPPFLTMTNQTATTLTLPSITSTPSIRQALSSDPDDDDDDEKSDMVAFDEQLENWRLKKEQRKKQEIISPEELEKVDLNKSTEQDDDDDDAIPPPPPPPPPPSAPVSSSCRPPLSASTNTAREPGRLWLSQFSQKKQANQTRRLLAPPRPPASSSSPVSRDHTGAHKKSSVSPQMMSHFQRLRLQVKLQQQQARKEKKLAKIEDRMQDVQAYRQLWRDFQDMECDVRSRTSSCSNAAGGNDASSLYSNASSFDLHDSTSWYFDFQAVDFAFEGKDKRGGGGVGESQASLSLLSAASLEAQRRIYKQKRKMRNSRVRGEDGAAATISGKPTASSTCSVRTPSPAVVGARPRKAVYGTPDDNDDDDFCNRSAPADYGPVRRLPGGAASLKSPHAIAHIANTPIDQLIEETLAAQERQYDLTNMEVSFSPERVLDDAASNVSDWTDDLSRGSSHISSASYHHQHQYGGSTASNDYGVRRRHHYRSGAAKLTALERKLQNLQQKQSSLQLPVEPQPDPLQHDIWSQSRKQPTERLQVVALAQSGDDVYYDAQSEQNNSIDMSPERNAGIRSTPMSLYGDTKPRADAVPAANPDLSTVLEEGSPTTTTKGSPSSPAVSAGSPLSASTASPLGIVLDTDAVEQHDGLLSEPSLIPASTKTAALSRVAGDTPILGRACMDDELNESPDEATSSLPSSQSKNQFVTSLMTSFNRTLDERYEIQRPSLKPSLVTPDGVNRSYDCSLLQEASTLSQSRTECFDDTVDLSYDDLYEGVMKEVNEVKQASEEYEGDEKKDEQSSSLDAAPESFSAESDYGPKALGTCVSDSPGLIQNEPVGYYHRDFYDDDSYCAASLASRIPFSPSESASPVMQSDGHQVSIGADPAHSHVGRKTDHLELLRLPQTEKGACERQQEKSCTANLAGVSGKSSPVVSNVADQEESLAPAKSSLPEKDAAKTVSLLLQSKPVDDSHQSENYNAGKLDVTAKETSLPSLTVNTELPEATVLCACSQVDLRVTPEHESLSLSAVSTQAIPIVTPAGDSIAEESPTFSKETDVQTSGILEDKSAVADRNPAPFDEECGTLPIPPKTNPERDSLPTPKSPRKLGTSSASLLKSSPKLGKKWGSPVKTPPPSVSPDKLEDKRPESSSLTPVTPLPWIHDLTTEQFFRMSGENVLLRAARREHLELTDEESVGEEIGTPTLDSDKEIEAKLATDSCTDTVYATTDCNRSITAELESAAGSYVETTRGPSSTTACHGKQPNIVSPGDTEAFVQGPDESYDASLGSGSYGSGRGSRSSLDRFRTSRPDSSKDVLLLAETLEAQVQTVLAKYRGNQGGGDEEVQSCPSTKCVDAPHDEQNSA